MATEVSFAPSVALATPKTFTKPFASNQVQVPEEGVEPSLPCENWILNPARLPFRHSGKCLANHQFTGNRQAVNGSSAA